MSKEKKLLPVVCTRGLSSYRTSRAASSVGNDGPTEKVVPTKRVCLGGRGREWAAESLRLLETMCNLEDAKLFLEPMNPLKYPEYYNLIHDPIDLSKIMLKFHGGAYPGLMHFSEDMDSMFDNYKQFFKDSASELYHQVRRLAKWFDAELDQIKCKWYRIYDNGTKLTSGGSGAVNPRSGSLDARIQAIKASNRRTVNLATKTESLPLQLAMNAIRLPRPLSALSLTSAGRSSASSGANNRTPVLAFRLASDAKSANSSSKLTSSSANPQSIILVSKSSADVGRTTSSDGSGLVYVCGDWSKQSSNHKPSSSVPGPDGGGGGGLLGRGGPGGGGGGSLLRLAPDVSSVGAEGQRSSDAASLKLDVGNIWFGTARNSMSHPVTVTEDGFHFLLKYADNDVSFTIQRDEIVKCAAYFGNIRKHTLFLFVLPNCVRRLAFLGEEFTLSSLIIMFPPALSQSEIAQLVYLFWRMSRLSMFGELFCEIDQKSAVALLGNIKPTIISNIAEKYKDALQGSSADAPVGVHRLSVDPRSLSNACRRKNVDNGASIAVATAADDGALLLSDSADAFSEVDCKIEPPDEIVDSDLERLGLSSIVDAKCLTVNEKLLSSDATVDDGCDGVTDVTKSDVIRKRLKIRYRPGILKHSSKRRKVEEVAQKNVNKETEEKSPLVEEEEEEDGDKEFTIIEWFPEDENPTAEDEESSSVSDSSVNNGSQPLSQSKDENDLEIVAPSNNSDTELDLDVNYAALLPAAEDEGVVMTGEKINIRCPITQQIMEYPVKNVHCNHCYDRQGIENLIKNRGDKAKCPVTGCSNTISLRMKDVKYDDQLSFYIQQKLNQVDSK